MITISVNEIKVSVLQKSINNLIAKLYSRYSIKNAYKVEQNKVITYDVVIKNGIQIVILSFDKNGSFIDTIEPDLIYILKYMTDTKTHVEYRTNDFTNFYY